MSWWSFSYPWLSPILLARFPSCRFIYESHFVPFQRAVSGGARVIGDCFKHTEYGVVITSDVLEEKDWEVTPRMFYLSSPFFQALVKKEISSW